MFYDQLGIQQRAPVLAETSALPLQYKRSYNHSKFQKLYWIQNKTTDLTLDIGKLQLSINLK